LVIGSNTTENHPVIANRIRRAVNRGAKLLLFDPRDIPMILTTGRVLPHFHTGTMTRKSKGLEALAPSPFVEVNPKDAQKLGVEDGDWVKVSSRRGSIELTAKVDDKVGVGVIFIPFHYHEAVVNMLTNPALDPTAKIPEYKVCAARLETTA
jgi:predicted molibdopterin-dependent oxidoreductase YjgC